MAIYRCEECDDFKDDDRECGQEWGEGLICESCADKHSCEWCQELDENLPASGMHIHCRAEARAEHQSNLKQDRER